MAAAQQPTDIPSGKGLRIAMVVGEWHKEHSEHMINEARTLLVAAGVQAGDISVVWVPGCLEIPVLCKALCDKRKADAILAMGIILRGETRHFEMIADSVAQALMGISVQTGIPILNEVIAANEMEHVLARTKPGPANKGREAAIAALKVVHALRQQ